MPNFEARTKEQLRGQVVLAKPGDSVPQADPDGMAYMGGAGSAFHKVFTYVTMTRKNRHHRKTDIVKAGYFNTCRSVGLAVRDIIECTIGDDPRTNIELRLRVTEVPRAHDKPIRVSTSRHLDFTPVDDQPLEKDLAA